MPHDLSNPHTDMASFRYARIVLSKGPSLKWSQTSNSYFICTEPRIIDAIFTRIRNFDGHGTSTKPSYPKSIAGLTVTSVRDLTIGYDNSNPPTYKPALPLSSGHMVQFRAENKEDGTKITLTTR